MSWMDNLKVVFKMAVLGVIAVAGLLGVSIAGYLGLNTVRGDLNTMYESSVKGIDYAGSAMSGMRYAQGMVIIMTTCRDDPARLQELNQKYQAGAKQVDDAIAFHDQVVTGLREQGQVRLVFQTATDRLLVQHAVGLRARRTHGRTLARIEDAKLDARLVGRCCHRAVERVDFLDQMALADAADRGVATDRKSVV